MPNASLQTTRFALQKIADGIIGSSAGQTAVAGSLATGSEMLEPQDYNAILQKLDDNLVSNMQNAFNSANYTLGTGVSIATQANHPWSLWRLRLTLTAALVAATNAQKYGHLTLITWPNSNIFLLNARMNLIGTKDGAQIQAADQPTVAVGSAVASNTTLATTMIDTIGIVTMAATASAVVQKNGPAALASRFIAAGASNIISLNIGATGNTGGGDGSVSFTGTVDLIALDLGTFGA